MKKLILILLLMFSVSGFANQPTVTQAVKKNAGSLETYKYTVTTLLTAADSVFLYKDNSDEPWDISHMGDAENTTNQFITFNFRSGEATLDSSRHTILHQISFAPNPSTAASSTDWITWESDVLDSTVNAIAKFSPTTYGRAVKYRAIVIENGTSKDAGADLTIEMTVPKTVKNKNFIFF